MSSIFLILIDDSGTMRSTEDRPIAAFPTRELAQKYLDDHTKIYPGEDGRISMSYLGGYSALIKEVPFHSEVGV